MMLQCGLRLSTCLVGLIWFGVEKLPLLAKDAAIGFMLPPSYHVLGLVWHWEIAILTALGSHLA
jgi:hypothetical protein